MICMENVMKERPYICAAKLHNIKMFVEYWILYLLCNAILIFYGPSLDGIVVPRGFPKESDSTWRATFEKFAMSAPVPHCSGFVMEGFADCRHSDPERIASRDPIAVRRA